MTAERLAVTVVGAGVVGTNLSVRLAELGHRVTFGARDPGSSKVAAARVAVPTARVAKLGEAADGADLVLLAVPFAAVTPALRGLGGLEGTVVIDVTNAVRQQLPNGSESVPDVIRSERPEATVVKAFNTVGAEVLLQPAIQGRAAFLPVAGPEPAAEQVRGLAAAMGFDAVVIGDASAARLLEDHARLWIHLASRTGMGRRFAFGLLRPEAVGHG